MHTDEFTAAGRGARPGAHAETLAEIPPKGWLQIARRGWKASSADQVPLMAAGVAFFGFLSLFPAMIAFTLVWGLVADPSQLGEQTVNLLGSLPPEVRDLVAGQLQQLLSAPRRNLGWGLAVTLLVALWSASRGVRHLVTAINIAYDEDGGRGFIRDTLVALGLTLGAIVFMSLAVAVVAGLPVVFALTGLEGGWRWVAEILRWVLLAAGVIVALSVLYRVAPHREAPRFRWASVGAVVATMLWLLASAGLSLYVSFSGTYLRTYGALAGVVVTMVWLWLTSCAVLLGAEVNAEAEAQTARDTTRGPAKSRGRRGAVKADIPPPAS